MRTFIDLKTDDIEPDIINSISIPYGLSLEYSYKNSKKSDPLIFTGEMDFLSIPGEARVHLDILEETALINIDLPTVKLGGGNLQLITREDLLNLYNFKESDKKDFKKKLDVRTDFNDLKKANTIKFKFEKDHLQESKLLLETNILIFEMIGRAISYLGEDFMSFEIQGNPFNGIFEAQTTVEILPVDSILVEENSVMKMELIDSKNLKNLQEEINNLLQDWVLRIIKLVEGIKSLKDVYSSKIDTREAIYIPVEE